MFEINVSIFQYLHGFAYDAPRLWLFLGGWFGALIIAGVFFFLILHKHSFAFLYKKTVQFAKESWSLFFIPFVTWLFAGILKLVFMAPRPYMTLEIYPLSMPGAFDSFPSGHAAFYTALAFAVYKHHKKAGWVFIGLAAVLSVSRIITGVHYPIDIIGGWLLAYLVYRLTK